jgi:hypothetical protein
MFSLTLVRDLSNDVIPEINSGQAPEINSGQALKKAPC